jgi:hypothetical protein
MKALFYPILTAVLLLGSPAGSKAPEGGESPAGQAADQTTSATPEAEAEAPPPAQQETADSLEEFVPSEKLPADVAVSFPVDI